MKGCIHIADKYKRMYDGFSRKLEDFPGLLEDLKGKDDLSCKDLVSVDELTEEDISLIFRLAWPFKDYFIRSSQKKIPLLKGSSIINFFFETSTRTKISFELAGKHLSADTINVSGSGTSMSKKGETLNDTIRTLNAMRADLVILRHSQAGTPLMIAKHIDAPVISAGDGWHEHPTQALLDAFTICESKGSCRGKKVCIVGDILHSRVAGSLMRLLRKMGAEVRVCGPPTMLPKRVDEVFGVEVFHDIAKALKGVDVIYSLRVQTERAAAGFIPTIREYSKNYVINPERLALASREAVVMHPGPVIREVDLRTEILEHPRCLVEDQVTNGFCVRMALLYLMVRGNPGRWKEEGIGVMARDAKRLPRGGSR